MKANRKFLLFGLIGVLLILAFLAQGVRWTTESADYLASLDFRGMKMAKQMRTFNDGRQTLLEQTTTILGPFRLKSTRTVSTNWVNPKLYQ